MKVHLDMDGVIANFNKKSLELIGKTSDDFEHSQDFWDALENSRFDIYLDLPLMDDAMELVEGIIQLKHVYEFDFGILTAIPKHDSEGRLRVPHAMIDKMIWLAETVPDLIKEASFAIGPNAIDKQNHCVPGDVLIDDSKLNIPQWNAKGGFGILHVTSADSLQQLRKYLEGK